MSWRDGVDSVEAGKGMVVMELTGSLPVQEEAEFQREKKRQGRREWREREESVCTAIFFPSKYI